MPAAQSTFDRGLALLYAFDIGQARDEFTAAATLDPTCAMAYWGESLTEITDINVTPDTAAIGRGATAIRMARSAPNATAAERQLIAAATLRFAAGVSEAKRQTAYATAMRAYAREHPADADGLVETAFAIWGLPSSVASAENADLGRDLDAALALDPNEIGALHLRIHYEEVVHAPERALGNADTLSAMAFLPGESHLDHMPGHIYDRVGDYAHMLLANERAVENDRVYFSFAKTLYPAFGDAGVAYMREYHQHDVDFLLYGYTTIGRDGDATALAARENAASIARVALRMHRPQLAIDAAPEGSRVVLAIANARLGRASAALKLLDKDTPEAGRQLVAAANARARGDARAEIGAYAAAYEAVGDSLGDPKSWWYAPVGEGYGAALLRAKRYAEAEPIFAAELKRYPNDPHLSFGLAVAQDARGESSVAAKASMARYWENAVPLTLDDLG